MMQEAIVAVIVVCAFWAVAKRYAPKPLRRATRRPIARMARRFGWTAVAARFETDSQTGASCADGCGTCGGCGPGDAEEDGTTADKQFTITPEALKRTIPH